MNGRPNREEGYVVVNGAKRRVHWTAPERRVVIAAANGLSSRETGELHYVSMETVKTHRRNLLARWGVGNMTQAVVLAWRANLLQADDIEGGRVPLADASKLISPEVEAFDIATPKLAGLVYGSEEYKQSLRDLGPALQHHFQHNDHHPEHFENGVRGMSLMALIEMLCDWRAASERTKQRTDDPEKVATFESGLAYQKDRFGMSDDLYEILLNTARELGL